jgi:hypothetical protein
MVKILYKGTRPFMLDGLYIHNDEVRNVTEETAKSLEGNPNFEIVDQPAVMVTPEPVYEIEPDLPFEIVEEPVRKVSKRGKKK